MPAKVRWGADRCTRVPSAAVLAERRPSIEFSPGRAVAALDFDVDLWRDVPMRDAELARISGEVGELVAVVRLHPQVTES